MVSPDHFMLSIAVLYCVTLSLFSCLICKSHLDNELVSEIDNEHFNQKVYHSIIPMETRKSFYSNLDIHEPDIAKLTFPDEDSSEILIESSVFHTLLSFHIENQNPFYIPSQIHLERPHQLSSSGCSLKSSKTVLSPSSSSKLGPLLCRFPASDEYSYTVYIISGKRLIEKVNIIFRIQGPKISLNYIQEDRGKITKKIQIKNIGDSSISFTGLFFDNSLCSANHLEILHCDERFELLPDANLTFELKLIGQFQGLLRSKLILHSQRGKLSIPIEIDFLGTSDSTYSMLFLFLGILIYFLCFISQPSTKRILISIKESYECPPECTKSYAKPILLSRLKYSLKKIQISKACTISDQFTMTSETTDTHLNSPTNSLNSEEISLDDDDYYLDSYKTSSLFSRNFSSSLLNN